MIYSFSDRSRVDVFNYRGWRPFRGLVLIAIGILAGFVTEKTHEPTNHQGPAIVDCAR
jgi:hypothetical protein